MQPLPQTTVADTKIAVLTNEQLARIMNYMTITGQESIVLEGHQYRDIASLITVIANHLEPTKEFTIEVSDARGGLDLIDVNAEAADSADRDDFEDEYDDDFDDEDEDPSEYISDWRSLDFN